ncbi:thiamine pyrophosphate-dependent enzyme [Pararhizobium sp. IMCC21322]|uniref:thiamine pyrophosphate-dependent enzyme n=1 Tax=Pararhizobium sp. IMCC21322 TaxID=3067903 RepID=UPI0027415B99|nr:thiamine pyrophosphate-dependent enzyme [Pararhizobium sp. IMCC21322]
MHNPSFSALARLCGGHGEKVTKTEDIGPAIERALAVNGPALVEIMKDAELV